MPTQTGSYDFKAAKAAHDEAAKVAGNYIVNAGTTGDVWIHSEGHGPDASGNATANTYGWRIGSVFELVRAGLSYFKMWVDNSVAKLRLGLEDSGHIELASSGIEFFSGSASIGTFGKKGARSYPPPWDVDYDSGLWQSAANAITFNDITTEAGSAALTGTGGLIGGYVYLQSQHFWCQIGVRQDTMRTALGNAGRDADSLLRDNVNSTSWNLQAANVSLSSKPTIYVRSSLNSSETYDVCSFEADLYRPVDALGKGMSLDANLDVYDLGCKSLQARDMELVSPLPVTSGGTGVNGTTRVTGSSAVAMFTPGSGILMSGASYATYGNLAMLELHFSHTASWSVGTQVEVGNVAVECRPLVSTSGSVGSFGTALLLTDGRVYVRPAASSPTEMAANGSVYVRFPVYLIA